jgi:hypothetical protein
MNDYHSNDNTWDRHDPPDPHDYNCPKCGGRYYHDDSCGQVVDE